MRKSRKQKKTNKRFSRNRKLKTKKTRKLRGGNTDDENIILVGFQNNAASNLVPPFIPIFLFKNVKYNLTERNKFSNIYNSIYISRYGGNDFRFSHIILPRLYELKNIRGLNLLEFLKSNIYFYDENGNPLINNRFVPTRDRDGNEHPPNWANNPEQKNTIREVELKYPGLFERIFVTPEEEQQALQDIEEKELEKSSTKVEGNKEIEQIKKTIEEMQRKIGYGKEEDEEKLATYAREMEVTNRMTPYLRAEQKERKKNKLANKKIDDFTNPHVYH